MASRQIARNVRSGEAKEFVKSLESLTYARHRWDVFSDWCVMASSAIYNGFHQDQAVEDQYLRTATKYKQAEIVTMCQMLSLTMAALAAERRDFMGEVYEGSLLANEGHGQFFTPYPVSRLLVAMTIGAESIPTNRVLTVADPAAGAGGMLVAFADELEGRGFDYANWACMYAQDIDPTCARMAYIQLSLIGAPAVVTCGDTLRNTSSWTWETPAYASTLMGHRLRNRKAAEERHEIASKPFDLDIEVPASASSMQLEFELSS